MAAPPPRISAEAFAARSAFEDPLLSPDGTKILARMGSDGKATLAVAELAGSGLEALSIPDDSDLLAFSWAGSSKVLITLGKSVRFYDEPERYVTRAFAYDLNSGRSLALGPKVQGEVGDDILWVDPEGQALLMAAQTDQYSYNSVFRVNLDNGKAELIQTPYEYVWDWYADQSGQIRAGMGNKERSWFLKYRRSAGGGYKNSPDFPRKDSDIVSFYLGAADSDQGYAVSDRSGYRAIYRYDFARDQLGPVVVQKDGVDIGNATIDQITGEIVAVSYTDDRSRTLWLDENREREAATLARTFGASRTASVVSRSRDKSRAIVWSGSVTDPGAYYFYDTKSGAIRRLAKVADKVDRAGLSETKPISYQARDGLTIPGYLTLPVGREAKNLPLIIMPHGGPYGVRDTLTYDPEVQFLANRGYVVLQPNFRGSSGLGIAFAEKGEGQWGPRDAG